MIHYKAFYESRTEEVTLLEASSAKFAVRFKFQEDKPPQVTAVGVFLEDMTRIINEWVRVYNHELAGFDCSKITDIYV